MEIFPRGNDALNVNPPVGVTEALSQHGSDWLWAVTAIYIVAFFFTLIPCFTTPESDRVFHYLLTMTLLVGSVTYFAQASDLGWISLEDSNTTRQIFYARYINWAVLFPSWALALGLLSGVSWTTIILNIFCAWYWVLTYLVCALVSTDYKWGFFTFGTFAYIILAMSTLNESREAAERLGIVRDYMTLSVIVNVLWICYPIAFGLSDGGNVIRVTGGFVFFGVLDVLLGPVACSLFVVMTRKWDYKKLNLAISEARYPLPETAKEPALIEGARTEA
ncbi:protein FDD123, putative [Talaromyces stipitatus ATCC 10500]|uniref:Protein FDD123, putative n=1 Tax=Talaromyces stipitatus (strain ATCC 10500 / CBS 375.48 / QM 6759 / NRRL 1006) TaxID=441959 RepID=B8LVG8_TALSN|nr:protein FDD123, putative [Talaromyces stipitatus ATCC 10500]EED23987.1 protein FDD123, putative [Talaromyces stipitatus ATCC 10500]